jgi:hypothetical protein
VDYADFAGAGQFGVGVGGMRDCGVFAGRRRCGGLGELVSGEGGQSGAGCAGGVAEEESGGVVV